MYMISIDPGICSGVAIWSPRLKPSTYRLACVYTAEGKGPEWIIRASKCTDKVIEQVKLFFAFLVEDDFKYTVHIEWPRNFNTVVGRAASQQGSIIKLAALCGMLHEAFRSQHNCVDVSFVPVNDWKGQLKKTVTNHRISKILDLGETGRLGSSDHQWDAVGIGLYVQGRF